MIGAQLLEEEGPGETVDPHRCQAHSGLAGKLRWLRRLLAELEDPRGGIDSHRPKLSRRADRHGERRDGDIRTGVVVGGHKRAIVHLVDMVAGEDDDESRRGHLEGVDVLENRIGGAEIPTLVDALLRRENVEELAEVTTEIAVPTEHEVPIEAHGLVLREHLHPTQPAVDAVGEGEVDDPVGAAEGDGWLGPVAGERIESGPLPPSQDDGDDIPQRRRIGSGRTHRMTLLPVLG